MCSESRDLFKFLEISGNTSATVQNRDTAAMKDWQEIVSGLSNGTIVNALEWPWRLRLLFETFITFTAHET